MKDKLQREQSIKIAIPKGEWLPEVKQLFSEKGFPLQPVAESELIFNFPYLAVPVLMVAVRARDVGQVVADTRSEFVGGFTGSDVMAEQQLTSVGAIPMTKDQAPARVVLGATPNWSEKVAKPQLKDLRKFASAQVATPYPRLTEQFLRQQGLNAEVLELQGATEAAWWAFPWCMAVLDVVVSGDTFRQNDIREIATVMAPVEIKALASEQITQPQVVVFEQVLEILGAQPERNV